MNHEQFLQNPVLILLLSSSILYNVKIVIEGHSDERGTEEYNLALGDRRAEIARNYLIEIGGDANQLESLSFGEERPFSSGHDERSWRLNRRVHFTVQR